MIWCLGMYSSGSTWLFNAARAVAAETGTPYRSGFAANARELHALLSPGGPAIIKTHELDTRAADLAAQRAAAICMTIRDPRDALVSVMERLGMEPVAALKLLARSAEQVARLKDDSRGLVFRYETGFFDDRTTFDRLAAMLNINLPDDARARLFAESRRAVIDDKIARMVAAADRREGDIVDVQTQWHGHHANRTGEVGRWSRVLTPRMVALVETRLRAWMDANGYPLSG